ncbi:alpha/beta fold hydrolase [Geoalkalibacter sp.]|jgi:pimeloyl-[acyl-carrier protein] methyl ester esterase|uniref:alpha/beta fold hydrolase n=1 Tax=Geoalkalibacter sp. TaxID=3041440 RepID=UPI00272EDE6C|nr:alpha/beta fold hydrolase [Geoalkalibacter sp.]
MMTLKLADGRSLAYREAGEGPALLLLHGWAQSSAVFAEVMPELARDFRVLAPDLRGHGGSALGERYALEDYAADVLEMLDLLGLGSLALGGWSLGGQVALRLAQSAPQRIRRLLLIGTTPRFILDADWPFGLPDAQVRSLSRNLQRAFEKTLADFFDLQFAPEEITPERRQGILGFARGDGRLPDPSAALGGLGTLREVDLRAHLGAIVCPTLVMHGAEDRIVPSGAGRFLAQGIGQARWCEMPGVGHAPFLSRPGQSLNYWREFLR